MINVGVSGPGVVKCAVDTVRGQDFTVLAETVKKTAFKITRMGQLVAKEASERLQVPFGIVDLSLAPTPGNRRQCCQNFGKHGTGALRRPGNDSRACPFERCRQKGRYHGVLARRRPQRRVYSGQRGRGHDRQRA